MDKIPVTRENYSHKWSKKKFTSDDIEFMKILYKRDPSKKLFSIIEKMKNHKKADDKYMEQSKKSVYASREKNPEIHREQSRLASVRKTKLKYLDICIRSNLFNEFEITTIKSYVEDKSKTSKDMIMFCNTILKTKSPNLFFEEIKKIYK